MRIAYNTRLAACLLLVTALTLGFCLLASAFVADTVEIMQQGLGQMEIAMQLEDWPEMQQALDRSQQNWQQARPYWLGLLNHQDVINIDLTLQSLQAYAQQQNQDEVLNQLALLDYYLNLAVESDRLNWSNLF